MKPEYINYGKQLSIVGDEMQKAADVFGEVSNMNALDIDSLKKKFNAYERANKGYKRCKQSLLKVNPPAVVNGEHREFADSFQLLIDSVETMLSAIDLDNATQDEKLLQQGFAMQRNAVSKAERIGDIVIKKLTNN